MRIVISFLCTQFEQLRRHWRENSQQDSQATGTGKPLGDLKANEHGEEPFLGGKVIMIDWPSGNVIWDIDVDAAGGFVLEDELLIVNNMRLHFITVLDVRTGEEIRRITNQAFNCIHSLRRTVRGYLVSSTGTDSIIEVTEQGESIFEWWATEHGYNRLPNGEIRQIDKTINHNQYIYPTLWQTTHINSAHYESSTHILSTLFHQGMLIRVDIETGAEEILLEGLTCPHAIKPFQNGWCLSDSKASRVLILNSDFKVCDVIEGDFDWVQDVCPLTNDHILIADANHNRIVEVDPENKFSLHEFAYSKDWRIYQIEQV